MTPLRKYNANVDYAITPGDKEEDQDGGRKRAGKAMFVRKETVERGCSVQSLNSGSFRRNE